jgi:hypothetical protein
MADTPKDTMNEEQRLRIAQGLDPVQNPKVVDIASRRSEDERSNIVETYLLSGHEFMKLEPPEPLIDGWIDEGTLAVLYGPPKAGKSFVAIDMMMCVASGSHWQGHPVKQKKVLYIVGEGSSYYPPRLEAWMETNKVYNSALDNIMLLTRSASLKDPEQVQDVIEIMEEHSIGLVIIDTLARAMGGAEENSNSEMSLVVNAIDKIRLETKATALVVHHSGKDESKGLRGASALLGAVDTSLSVKKTNGAVIVAAEDQRGRAESGTVYLQLKEVGKSAALVSKDVASLTAEEAGYDIAMKTLRCLERIDTEFGSKRGSWEAQCKELGIPSTTFDQHVKILEKHKKVHQKKLRGPWYLGPKPEEE